MLDINPKDYQSENILSHEEIIKVIKKLRKQKKKIGLAAGCFDLLHPGHIAYLEEAKKMCDVLIVAVVKDDYISKTRNNFRRPLFSEQLRAFMISKLKSVDFVILDEGATDISNLSFDVVNFIKPDAYIKGKDHANDKDSVMNHYKRIIKSFGGEIIFTKTEKLSSTDIIQYIKEKL